jgi:hypothetical protein
MEPVDKNSYLLLVSNLEFTNKILNNTIEKTFPLEPSYRIVTLQKDDDKPYSKLVKIITNQIKHKSYYINLLFAINCFTARRNVKERLENQFIKDYIIHSYKKNPSQLAVILQDLFLVDPLIVNIKNLNELNNYLETLNYTKIKSELNFEINIFNTEIPKFLVKFNNHNSKSKIINGLYNTKSFKNNSSKFTNLVPIIKFDDNVNYVFDQSDIKYLPDEKQSILSNTILDSQPRKLEYFFDKIKPIQKGLIIILNNSNCYSKPGGIARAAAEELQNKQFYTKKYKINYT